MKRLLAVLFVAFIAAAGVSFQASAQTQQPMDVQVTVLGHAGSVAGSPSDSFLTFHGPVQIPGVGLAAGQYLFRYVTPSVMQVLSANGNTIYATFFVIPAERAEASDEFTVTLRRVLDTAPPRLITMFKPGAINGVELLYPSLPKEGVSN
jgi:hypothetical protein